MKTAWFVLVAICIILVMPGMATAQQQGKEEMVSIPKSQLTPAQIQQVEETNLQNKIAAYGKWVGLGKEIGDAVNGSLGALTDQADKLSKTDVGKFTMFMVAWKVLGTDLIQFLIGVPFLFFGLIFWAISFRKNALPYLALAREQGDKKEYEIVEPGEMQQWGHVVALLILILVSMLVIFG